MTNGRDVAALALHDREGNVSAHLDRLLYNSDLSAPERALARELALGALRRRGTLRAVLRSFLSEPGKALPGVLNEVLLVGLYQILFLDRVPDFAAVNETVEQATRFHHRRQSGLVNGVLRNVTRNLGPYEDGPPPLTPDVIPVSPRQFRRCKTAVFPDPATNPDGYIAEAFSLPPRLVQRWLRQYGPLDRVAAIAMHANVRAPLIVRVNTQRTSVAEVIADFKAAGIEGRPHENAMSIVLPHCGAVEDLPGFAKGVYQPQDPTATQVGKVAGELARDSSARPGGDPSVSRSDTGTYTSQKDGMVTSVSQVSSGAQYVEGPRPRVLDFCAAPGTKTTHVAQLLNNAGAILALDTSEPKLQRITENCQRMGVANVRTMLADRAGTIPLRSFDVVLADVPCSNTGVLARRPEARWRFSEDDLGKLVKDQQFLAAAAARFVAPGGHLVYSTCSIEEEEGPQVVKRLLEVAGHLELVSQQMTMPAGADDPTKWHDGGYMAVLRAKL